MLEQLLNETLTTLNRVVGQRTHPLHARETGRVTHVGGGIARIKGLSSIRSEELVSFPGDVLGVAINLEPHQVGQFVVGGWRQ